MMAMQCIVLVIYVHIFFFLTKWCFLFNHPFFVLQQYLSPYKLKELIRHYSEFVTHPVSLRQIKTIQVPKEKDEFEEAEVTEDEKKDDDIDDIEVSDDEDKEEEEKEPEMEEVTTYEYEQINTDPAIWARDKETISDDEYQEFWSVVSKEGGKAEDWTHFNAE